MSTDPDFNFYKINETSNFLYCVLRDPVELCIFSNFKNIYYQNGSRCHRSLDY